MRRTLHVLSLLALLQGVISANAAPAKPDPDGFQGRGADKWAADLTSANPETRRSAAFALGKCGAATDPYLEDLRKALGDMDEGVREAAAFALGDNGMGTAEAVQSLADRLGRDDKPSVRRAAARALGQFAEKAEAALPALHRALHDDHAGVRQNAAWAIGRIPSEKAAAAVGDLVRLLADANPMVRRDAALTLGQIRPPAKEAVQALVQCLGDGEDPVRHNAVDALAMIGPDAKGATAALVAIVKNPPQNDEELRRKAMVAAGAIGGPELKEIMTQLRAALRDKENSYLREAAARALVNMGTAAMPALNELKAAVNDDPLRNVRQLCALAFMTLAPELRGTTSAKPITIWMLQVIDKADEDTAVRTFLVQALFGSPLPSLKGIDPQRDGIDPLKVLTRAALESPGKSMRILRYEAARVAVGEFGANARSVTPVLIENLEDGDLTIIRSTGATTTTTGGETTTIGGGVDIKGSGDGRVLPAAALGELARRAPMKAPTPRSGRRRQRPPWKRRAKTRKAKNFARPPSRRCGVISLNRSCQELLHLRCSPFSCRSASAAAPIRSSSTTPSRGSISSSATAGNASATPWKLPAFAATPPRFAKPIKTGSPRLKRFAKTSAD